jgi:hypothetical protein
MYSSKSVFFIKECNLLPGIWVLWCASKGKGHNSQPLLSHNPLGEHEIYARNLTRPTNNLQNGDHATKYSSLSVSHGHEKLWKRNVWTGRDGIHGDFFLGQSDFARKEKCGSPPARWNVFRRLRSLSVRSSHFIISAVFIVLFRESWITRDINDLSSSTKSTRVVHNRTIRLYHSVQSCAINIRIRFGE